MRIKMTLFFGISFFLIQALVAQTEIRHLSTTTGAASYKLTVVDGYLYSGEGNTLSVYNLGPNVSPPYEKVFEYRTPSVIDGFTRKGNQLYLANNTGGISKWDINNPENPQLLMNHQPENLDEAAYDIAFKGDTLFVAYKTKLSVFRDLGNSLQKIVDLYTVPFPFSRIRGCAVKDSILAFTVGTMSLFTSNEDGVHLYDARTLSPLSVHVEKFCDPEELIFGQQTSLLHVIGGGQLTSSIAPFIDSRGHFYSLDISTPSEPELVFADTIPGIPIIGDSQAVDADIQNDTLYVATRTGDDQIFPLNGNVFAYDLTDPNDLHFIQHIDAGLLHFDVALDQKILHIASEWFGIRSVDLTDFANPITLGDTPTGGWNISADIFENKMVLANEGYGFQLFDISDPFQPERIDTHLNINSGFNYNINFSADGQHIFAVYLPGFTSFQVFETSTLERVGTMDFFTGSDHTCVFENWFVASASGILSANYLSITDVSNPEAPVLAFKRNMNVNDLFVDDDGKLFVCRNDSLLVYDLNNDFEEVLGLASTDNQHWDRITKYQDEVFIYRNNVGLIRYIWNDVSNSLTAETTVELPNEKPTHLAADSFALYLGYTEFGLYAYDRNNLTEIDYFRTGLDFIFPSYWELSDLKTINGFIVLSEYFGQTSLLTMNDALTGIQTLEETFTAVQAFPNPLADDRQLYIHFLDENKQNKDWTLAVYDVQGRMFTLPNWQTETGFQLDGQSLPTGIYFVRGNNTSGEQFVVKAMVQE